MTAFSEAEHPRGGYGQFTTKVHSEAAISLTDPTPAPQADVALPAGLLTDQDAPEHQQAEVLVDLVRHAAAA